MTTDQIKAIQTRIGTTADGQWGPKSRAALDAHLSAMLPNPNPWPKSDDASMVDFYGRPGDEANLVNLDVRGLGMKYCGQPVNTIRCHKKCAQSLKAALVEISHTEHAHILDKFAGCYAHRQMRGGKRWSKHAWGAAIDLAPATNGLHMRWPEQADMPLEVMEIFAKHGARNLGWVAGVDSMHAEWTQGSF